MCTARAQTGLQKEMEEMRQGQVGQVTVSPGLVKSAKLPKYHKVKWRANRLAMAMLLESI